MLKQFKQVTKEVKGWPKWMRIAAGLEEAKKKKCCRTAKH